MKKHEKYVEEMILDPSGTTDLRELLAYHDKQIRWMQHERLAHCIVMLFVCLFMLLVLGFTIIYMSAASLILSTLLLILTAAYIFHYFRLENGVQRWYNLSNRIRQQL
jgi:hypothetical protein